MLLNFKMQQSAGISSTVGSQIPGHLTSQIIPGAEWVYIDLHHSQALLQEITIDGFALAKFAAMATRAVTFKIVPTQSIVALLYMIAGELAFSINGLQDAFFKNENRQQTTDAAKNRRDKKRQ